jgi:hypothetical protein
LKSGRNLNYLLVVPVQWPPQRGARQYRVARRCRNLMELQRIRKNVSQLSKLPPTIAYTRIICSRICETGLISLRQPLQNRASRKRQNVSSNEKNIATHIQTQIFHLVGCNFRCSVDPETQVSKICRGPVLDECALEIAAWSRRCDPCRSLSSSHTLCTVH